MYRGLRLNLLIKLIFGIAILIVGFKQCGGKKPDPIDREETKKRLQETRRWSIPIPWKEVEDAEEKKVFDEKNYSIPKKETRKLGGKNYKLLDFGPDVWMAEDLDYNVGESYLYGGAKTRIIKSTRFYSLEDARKACHALGMKLPSNQDWLNLLVFVAGNDNSAASAQGFDKLKAYGSLTVSEGIGFNVRLNGRGYRYDTGEIEFEGKGEEITYWTSSFDSREEFSDQPLIITFKKEDVSVERFRLPNSHNNLYACRCVKNQ
jgi:uncharacterized protein (TIGR02145 family)